MAKHKGRKVLYQILAIILIVFLYLPIYQMLITALRPANLPWISPMPLFPEKVTFENFKKVLDIVPRFPRYLLNSFIYGVGVSLISILVGIPAGYALGRYEFVGRRFLMVFIIYANMFAPIMLLVPIYIIMKSFNLINTYLSVILAGSIFTIPLSTWLITSYMQTIPKSIEEAALIDGCSYYGVITRIVIPMISPAIVSVFIYAFVTGWSQQFILALTLIKDDMKMPITQGLYQFFSRSSVRWNELMAAILLSTFIPVIMFLLVQKYIVKGLTAGSLKE
ncbi:MAG TPA: ABC transporter permease [Petrotoga sp.]|jgi:multiple sugar transport system permease protein|nr:ABC transporter permease [Petrotoga sp.]